MLFGSAAAVSSRVGGRTDLTSFDRVGQHEKKKSVKRTKRRGKTGTNQKQGLGVNGVDESFKLRNAGSRVGCSSHG